MNNITINSNSNDIKEMEKLFPRAPLKIIAMEGCKELGQKVNDYIVNFRQSSYREEMCIRDSYTAPTLNFSKTYLKCHTPTYALGIQSLYSYAA